METLRGTYTIVAATHPQQARKLARKSPQPDLILLDIVMPEVDGYELCAEFKQDPTTQAIPIVFLTALKEPQDEVKGFQLGGADYILKPVDPIVLKARIKNHLTIVQLMEQQARAEQRVTQTNQQLQAVLNAVPGMVSWISRDLKYLGCNQHLADAYEMQPEDFVGHSVGFQAEPIDFRKFVKDFFASSEPEAFKEILVGIKGNQQPYYLVSQKYDDGNAAVFVGINVTDREQAKAALKDSETRFRSLVEQINDWVWEIDLDSRFTYISPKAQEVTGYQPDELIGKQFTALMSADEGIRLMTIFSHFMRAHQPFTQIEVNCQHRDGRSLVLEISGAPILAVQGKVQGYRGITRDVTERKQVEIDIRKALTKEKELSDLKTRFISMASHEFRTPLTTVLASAESLERYRHKFSHEKQTAVLKRIKDSVHHINSLLKDVLTAGKAEAGKFVYQPASLNLREFCVDLIDEIQVIQSGERSQIQFEYSGETAIGKADEKLLRHILINLLSNAIKYSPDHTPVTFSLTVAANRATFQVVDQGIGISAPDQAHLFNAFHRGHNVGNISGTGLGLMIAKQATEAHQGTISCFSELGVGTKFVVDLPFFH